VAPLPDSLEQDVLSYFRLHTLTGSALRAYVRHNHSNHNQLVFGLRGVEGGHEAYQILKARVRAAGEGALADWRRRTPVNTAAAG
jgi:hypothetical protein